MIQVPTVLAILFAAGAAAAPAPAEPEGRPADEGAIPRLEVEDYHSSQAVAFSPDGSVLASGGAQGDLKLVDVRTGLRRRTLRGHPDRVLSLSFRPDGRLLASTGGG